MSRRTLAALGAALALVTGCAPPPQSGPGLAVGGGSADERTGDGGDRDAEAGPPPWLAPTTDTDWRPCAGGRGGQGVSCASITAPRSDGGSGEVAVKLARASAPDTPPDAPPLVVVAGPGRAVDELAARLVASGDGLLPAHPVVVVGHRGEGVTPDTCLTSRDRAPFDALGTAGTDPASGDVRAGLTTATLPCLDALSGAELDYGAAGAARDLETVRTRWGVPGLALFGLGDGAGTAMRYAAAHPEAVVSLTLDSTPPLGGSQEDAGRAAAEGTDAALRQWAEACNRPECGAADPTARVDGVRRALEAARRPGAPVPPQRLLAVLRSALADVSGASEPSAAGGDAVLAELAGGTPGRESLRSARELGRHALGWIAGCTDLPARVPTSRIAELDAEWSSTAPVSGALTAAGLAACSTWPVPEASPLSPRPDVPVLVLGTAVDPSAGPDPARATADALHRAGVRTTPTVTWHAPGRDAVLHSRCARDAVAGFLADPRSAAESAACPS